MAFRARVLRVTDKKQKSELELELILETERELWFER